MMNTRTIKLIEINDEDESSIRYEFNGHITIDVFMEYIRSFMLALGYSEDTIRDYFRDEDFNNQESFDEE